MKQILILKAVLLLTANCLLPTFSFSQNVGINTTGALPDASSMLDVSSDSKGLLIPRVSLTSTTDAATIANPAISLLVYNNNAAMTGGSVGYWYWDGAQWVQFGTGGGGTAWELLGNAGTIDGTNFIGTTDNIPFNIRVNNQKAGKIDHLLQNTFWGYRSGNANTTGIQNTATGWGALYSNTTGGSNTANGMYALWANTDGIVNTACGWGSLSSNTTGQNNTASGHNALAGNITGNYNTASGMFALRFNTAGSSNTAAGREALFNSTGSWNTAVGDNAGYTNTTGTLNTYLGYQANGSATLTNATAVGANASVTTSNSLVLGNAAKVGIGTTAPNPSAKLDITSTNSGLLIPRVSLTSTTDVATIASPATSLLVYNTNAAMTGGSVGYWYWDGAQWAQLGTGGGGGTAWELLGNAGTTAGTNFVGTTDNQAFDIRTNNTIRTRITTKGQIETLNTGWSVFIGEEAGANDDLTSNQNVFIGRQAGRDNTTGVWNTAVGNQVFVYNTTGYGNTAVGSGSLLSNTTGFNNTALGGSTLYSTTTGTQNTATGIIALYYNTTGNYNTANGYRALYYNTGDDNAALGYRAGDNPNFINTTHNQCTFIGSGTTLTTNRTNVTMLGYGIVNVQCTDNNQVCVGNTALVAGGLRAAVTGWTAYSDVRFKTNIKENVAGLDFILKLKPVTYNVRPTELHKIWGTSDSLINKIDHSEAEKETRIGFLAQDVEKAAKECGFNFPGIDAPRNENEVYTLRYVDFIMPMVKGMQEQQKIIGSQQSTIDNLQTTVGSLQTENKNLKYQNSNLKSDFGAMKSEIQKIKTEQQKEISALKAMVEKLTGQNTETSEKQ